MKTTLEVTIVRLRLVREDDEFTADEHPTLSGMRCAADVGVSSEPVGPGLALRKCPAEAREFPWRKARKR